MGVLSDGRPSNGPGLIVSIFCTTLVPPLIRGLSGAILRSCSGERCCSCLPLVLGLELAGVWLRFGVCGGGSGGNGGKGLSKAGGISGDGWSYGPGIGLVALRISFMTGDLAPPLPGGLGERRLGSLWLLPGVNAFLSI